MIAHVIVDVIHTNVAKPFSYLIPDGMQVEIGMRVHVPLGSRKVDGIVSAITADCDIPVEKLKPIVRCLDPFPAVLPHMMALAEELAQEDHCPLAETLRLMLPAALRTGRAHSKEVAYYQLADSVRRKAGNGEAGQIPKTENGASHFTGRRCAHHAGIGGMDNRTARRG